MERLDIFMARANAAYYANHDPFADFVTAPEITQVFGELLGLWAAIGWETMGSPSRAILTEAGPGRGTLMADALRAIRQMMPNFAETLEIHLIETSPALRKRQAEKLGSETPVWHDALDTLPEVPLLLLANEFLDALPIRQIVRRGEGWSERFVQNGKFVELPSHLAEGRAGGPHAWFGAVIPPPGPLPREGEVLEINEAAVAFARAVAARIVGQGGAALFVDYGPEESAPGESLQALRHGKPADPLASPGEADLTAHVDFSVIAAAARSHGAAVYGPIPQGPFLARLGLFQRTGQLARTQPPRRAGQLIQAAQRLAEPDRMGRLFKALAICHPSLPVPPGFTDAQP